MNVTFLLNGESVTLRDVSPTQTLLEYLREIRNLTGTKEGCNEGDCGACSIMVTHHGVARALNACILFLPQLHGKAVRTVDGLRGRNGELHPIQQAMIDLHGSQCGFCTPGFVMSMVVGHMNGRKDHADVVAGNLCRCTGYLPILEAAKACEDLPVPNWLVGDFEYLGKDETEEFAPATVAKLASVYETNPDAVIVAGATDVGLWVTKGLQDLGKAIFLNRCAELREVVETDDMIRFGAGVPMDVAHDVLGAHYPSFGEMIRRFASVQIRGSATLGGNIANGSPIGDSLPPLIALGTVLHLRKGDQVRDVALEEFFIDYGKQDRTKGEFVEAVSVPKVADRLKVYKLSKRFDQDISAVCGAFYIEVTDGVVSAARIAFGGMAGIPKRAGHVEAALTGQSWQATTLDAIAVEWAKDFTPLSDMRASADYRLMAARNMLTRYLMEDLGAATSVLEVTP